MWKDKQIQKGQKGRLITIANVRRVKCKLEKRLKNQLNGFFKISH